MKTQLTSLELVRVTKELKELLINGKINQVYVDFDRAEGTKKELLFEIYAKGKQLLRIILPSFIFLASIKPETPQKPDGYCLYLRKYLKNARIKDIEQIGTERILKFTVEARDITKEDFVPITYFIYFELFSKGNMILTNEQNIILSPLEVQEWSERKIRPKETYHLPQQEHNVLKMGEKDFQKAMEMSEKDSVVTTLALDFGLGGIYAEEVCLRAEIPKETKKPTKKAAAQLYNAFKDLVNDICSGAAIIIKQNDQITDVFPCALRKNKEQGEEVESFTRGLDLLLLPTVQERSHPVTQAKKATIVDKLKTMIKSQEKQIVQCREEYMKNQELGEKIYTHYQLLDDIFKQLQDARKIKSWDEMKKAIKGHKVVKQINEKNQEVVVEL
jgi:predicted ribosome quality control (RQC) complex YloA/Tae2 family protein